MLASVFVCHSLMKSSHCVVLLLVALLSACDAEKPPAPAPKVAAPAAADQSAAAKAPGGAGKSAAPVAAPEKPPALQEVPAPAQEAVASQAPVHELKPNMPTVKVVTESNPDNVTGSKVTASNQKAAQKAAGSNAKSAKVKADNAEVARRAPVASKSKSASQVVKDTRLPKAGLDLSLPPEMIKQMAPPPGVITAANRPKPAGSGAKPLLPKMFPDADHDPDFQLQGRLLSNEMQLQLRNESRKDVEGAALDFKFKQ